MATSRRDGVGLLLEGVVILVSILAAFFLEGWRGDRELARDLSQELASVQLELERNRDLAELEIVALGRILAGGNALTAALEAADGAPYVAVVDTLAWLGTTWNVSFSPSLGAVDALIASGRLAQVANPELRLGLAGLQDVVTDAFEEEVFAREIATRQVVPLVGEHVDLNSLFDVGNRFFAPAGDNAVTPQERVRNRALQSSGTIEFPTRIAVRSAISHRLGWLSSARSEFQSLQLHLETLIDWVSEELN